MKPNEIKKALEQCPKSELFRECVDCPYSEPKKCINALLTDSYTYINQLEAEVEKYHKELLKSKVFKFVRNPNQIYSVADFRNGEILKFFDYPENPNALAQRYYNFKNKDDIRLLHISEVKELSYEEVKSEIIKEFAERFVTELIDNYDLKSFQITNVKIIKDNLLKELVGDEEWH